MTLQRIEWAKENLKEAQAKKDKSGIETLFKEQYNKVKQAFDAMKAGIQMAKEALVKMKDNYFKAESSREWRKLRRLLKSLRPLRGLISRGAEAEARQEVEKAARTKAELQKAVEKLPERQQEFIKHLVQVKAEAEAKPERVSERLSQPIDIGFER